MSGYEKALSTECTPANIARLLELLADSPGRFAALIAGLPEARLHERPATGERTLLEILGHVLHVEARSTEAITLALLASEPLLVRVHPERQFGALLRYQDFPPADLLAYQRFRRSALLRVLANLDPRQWQRVVREEGKQRKESVYWIARGLALHEQDHLDETAARVA